MDSKENLIWPKKKSALDNIVGTQGLNLKSWSPMSSLELECRASVAHGNHGDHFKDEHRYLKVTQGASQLSNCALGTF